MKYLLAFLGVCCVVAAGVGHAFADTTPNGITVSPTIEQLMLRGDQTSGSYIIHVTNNTSSSVVITAMTENFSSFNQNGGIKLHAAGQPGSQNSHGLANNITVVPDQIALSPGQSQAVQIAVSGAGKLSAGGHYAAILFRLSGSGGARGNRISVNQELASLLFVSSQGSGTQHVQLAGHLVNSFTTTFPSELSTAFANSGNTQTTPRGTVQILNAWSHVVSQGQINVDSGLVLPESSGLFDTAMVQTVKRPLFGFYRVKVVYGYDGSQPVVYVKNFIYASNLIIGIAIVCTLLVVAALLRKFAPKPTYRLKTR